MKKLIYYLSFLFVFISCVPKSQDEFEKEDVGVTIDSVIRYGVDVTDLDCRTGVIRSGQLLAQLFDELKVPDSISTSLLTLSSDDFDVRRLRAGNGYTIFFEVDSVYGERPVYFVYHHSLVESTVFSLKDSLSVSRFEAPTHVVSHIGDFEIVTSLWNAVIDARLSMDLVNDLSDIFAWTVDFFGLQRGDRFRVYYDEIYVDSIPIGIGNIYGAYYESGEDRKYAIRFQDGGVNGYWDLEGNSVKKAFLKAPLHFSRISSGFTYARRHPVHKTVRPHTGVDYAAPAGTPVVAIGDGIVVACGYQGGGGNTVKIRHNSTYESAYLHLRGFGKGIRTGARVSQGQVIGYVGSTGTSTGAHLDFRIWKGGIPVNPLTLDAPSTEPIPDGFRAAFDSIASIVVAHLDSI